MFYQMRMLIYFLALFTANIYSEENPDLAIQKLYCKDINDTAQSLGVEIKQGSEVIKINDQIFYALFTEHLSSELRNRISLLTSSLDIENKRKEIMRELRDTLSLCSHIIESEKSDVSIIVKLLQSPDTHLKWIGIELSENQLKTVPIQIQVEQYKKLKNNLTLLRMDDLLYLIFDNHIIALAEHPELFEKIEFIPLDSDFHKTKFPVGVLGTIIAEMIQMYQIMPEETARLADIATATIMNTSKIPEEKVSAELSKIENTAMRALAASFFEHINQYIEEIWERDKIMALTALRQTGNGLILLGPLHLKGVTQHLRSAKKD